MSVKKVWLSNSKTMKKYTLYSSLKDVFRQFCKNTSVHGFTYIAQVDKLVSTRFAWSFVLSAIFMLALFLCWGAWYNSIEEQVIIISDSIVNPIWHYPFPAVTICNLNKLSLKKVTVFATKFESSNLTQDEIIYLSRHLVQMQYMNYIPKYENEYVLLQNLLDSQNISTEDAIWQTTPDCNNLITACSWKNRIWRCDGTFEETLSSLGICCSFNYYGFKNTSFSGYLSERYKTTPRKISATGSLSGLRVVINNEPEDYFISEIQTHGVKVILHDSYDFPGFGASNAIIDAMTYYFIAVNPTQSYATPGYRKMDVDVRECLFSDERQLNIFNQYSWVNCMTECRIMILYKYCGCVPYFVRNKNVKWLPTEKSCNMEDLRCLSDYKEIFFNSFPDENLPDPIEGIDGDNPCACLPECEDRSYFIESSRTTFSRKNSINDLHLFTGIAVKNHSVVNIFFKDLLATRNKKDVPITWYSEVALFGGLLGICFGFSFTSAFEIAYTFTIQLLLNFIRKNKKIANKQKQHDSYYTNISKEFDKSSQQIWFTKTKLEKFRNHFQNDKWF